jgi:hypothetical protein
MGWTTTGNGIFTINLSSITTASTATTITYTFSSGTTPVPEEKPKPKPKEKETFDSLVAGMKFRQPEMLPPKRYGTCMRCSISVDVAAFQGRCSACGGPLANR